MALLSVACADMKAAKAITAVAVMSAGRVDLDLLID
jgi:hypothetical protein